MAPPLHGKASQNCVRDGRGGSSGALSNRYILCWVRVAPESQGAQERHALDGCPRSKLLYLALRNAVLRLGDPKDWMIAMQLHMCTTGRFRTLREVLEFYAEGVQSNRDLDPRLRNADGTPRRLGLDSAQVRALVAFLGALTDTAFLKAERFADPFPCHGKR